MKELILMRHAKSSWDFHNLTDHERPLNKRGKSDAKKMGNHLLSLNLQPQLILSSDSKRTQETVALLCTKLSRRPLVFFLPSLYHASLGAIQEAMEFIHPQADRIMLVGHNPGWSETHHWLTGIPVDFKTATISILSNSSYTWQEAIQSPGTWSQEHIFHPKEI